MREIKFRGKRLDNGEWAYSYYVAHRTNIGDNKLRHLIICDEEMSHQHPVDPETIGQYTGLKDKNGKEIYAGDICWASFRRMSDCNMRIEWVDQSAGFFLIKDNTGYDIEPDNVEIIGNIYENPKLI